MKYKAHIQVMPHKVLLDPQGKTVTKNLKHIGLDGLTNVRIGKNIELEVEATNQNSADALVKSACEKLLTNPIMEYFEYSLTEAH
jgi:phosphoribosylformylglycinamidine synthase